MMHVVHRCCVLALIAAHWVATPHTACAQQLAIRAGRIITVSSEPIDDGVILIRDGKITGVGKDLAIPIEARVIDASGKTVMPGFVDVHNSSGMSQANERNPNVPFLSVVDTIDPSRSYFEECRRNGVTTVSVVPGNSTMIGGQAAIVKAAGDYVDDMLLKRQAGIKLSLSPTSGSRMSHLARLRKELEEARLAEEKSKEDEDDGEKNEPEKSDSDEKKDDDATEEKSETSSSDKTETNDDSDDQQAGALRKLVRGELPAFVYCENGMDVLHAIELTKEYKLKTILILGEACYRAVEQVVESKLPVVLDPTLVFWRVDPRTGDEEKIVVPKIYHEKNVPLTFQANIGSSATLGTTYLWYQAATAVKYGLPMDEALRCLTLRPAEILGIDKFVGSIEVGKDADLIVLSGEPLRVGTWVEKTIVDGKVVYEREKDDKLRELLEPKVD